MFTWLPLLYHIKGVATRVIVKSMIKLIAWSRYFIDDVFFAFVKIPFFPCGPLLPFWQYELRFSLLKYSQAAGTVCYHKSDYVFILWLYSSINLNILNWEWVKATAFCQLAFHVIHVFPLFFPCKPELDFEKYPYSGEIWIWFLNLLACNFTLWFWRGEHTQGWILHLLKNVSLKYFC